MKLRAALALLLWARPSWAQEHKHTPEVWVGVMTSSRISEKLSLWNDTHYASRSFLIGRHGLSVHLHPRVVLTGGYAWLFLATPRSTTLDRREHRPWWQLVITTPLDERWQVQNRFRHDLRWRQDLQDGAPIDAYGFTYRFRHMFNVRRALPEIPWLNRSIFLSMNSELLFGFGGVSQHLDQIRTSALIGWKVAHTTLQIGYMHRYAPPSAPGADHRHMHGITFWINQAFNVRRRQADPPRTLAP